MNDLTDREFGDYHIIRRIGSGSTADVFLAEQRSLGRRVALKILRKDLANEKTYLRRFVREAKAIAALNHPSLVQIYQTDCLDGYWFIAQEYVQGETLQQAIQRAGTLPAATVVDILWQVAAAFETAAEAGIVHRDIKPENILIGQNGIVKVTDFGLAHIKVSAERTQLALTEAGMTLGTPLYMSPEQAQGHKLDHRSDIYSLGITCWHALTGKPPFMGGTALSVALQHVNNSPPPLVKQRPDIPTALVAIVERMIEKKPANRFQSFHSILRELHTNGLTSDKPVIMAKTGLPQQSARYALHHALEQRRTRWSRMIAMGLFALCLSLLGWTSGLAYRTWIDPPFGVSRTLTIPQKSTVEEQWIYACFLNTPDAWQAVIEHFPEEEFFWGHKAKRQLIRYYYHDDDTSHNSFRLFWDFGTLAYSDWEDQILGLAGAAWCAAVNVPDIKVAQGYLNEIQMIRAQHGLPFDWFPDGLSRRIYEAAEKIIQQKEKEVSKEAGI